MTYNFSSWRRAPLLFVVAFGVCLLLVCIPLLQRKALAANGQNERVVTIFDGQQAEQTFVTNASTVREALERGGIDVSESDGVEPRLDTELVASNYNINIYRARPVVLVDGAQRINVMSPHKSARQVVEKAGIELHPEDKTVIERVESIETEAVAAQKITIDRATPLQMVLYGKKTDIRTQAATVGELVKEKNITLGPQDGTSLPLTQPIEPGMLLEIWRDGKQTITEEQQVAFVVRQIQDKDREVGFKEVKTPGKNGLRVVTYEIEMRNGKEVNRKEVQSVTTTEPVEQVEIVGAKRRGGSPAENKILGKQMMLEAGFGEDQWSCLDNLWTKESGWNQYSDNPSSDAYGIPQALPGSKMGAGWESDPEVQIRWGLGYIKGRYSTPCGAWNHFLAKRWY